MQLVCGRCGRALARNSTYCAFDRWALLSSAAAPTTEGTPIRFELPDRSKSFLARKRLENARDSLDKSYRTEITRRLERLEQQLEETPGDPQLLRVLGLLALLQGQIERANGLFERAHGLFTGAREPDFETQINYAVTLARRGQLAPSLALLDDAATRWPDQPLAHLNRAIVALRAHRPRVVFEAVGRLEALWRDNAALETEFKVLGLTLRGLASLHERNFEPAMRDLLIAAGAQEEQEDTAPTDEKSNQNGAAEGANNGVNGSSNGSPSPQKKAMSSLPGEASAEALNNLAVVEAESGLLENAVAHFKIALQLDPSYWPAMENLGVLAYRQGRPDIALQFLNAASSVQDALGLPQPTTLNHIGVVRSALGDTRQGFEAFKRAGSLEHGEFEVFYNLGRAFIEHGQLEAGAAALRQAFTIDPQSANVHTVLGAAYLFAGKVALYGEALKHLKRSLQISPHDLSAGLNLALTFIEIRNREAAFRVLSQIRKDHMDAAEVTYLTALFNLDGITSPPNSMMPGDDTKFVNATQGFERALKQRTDVVSALYNSALCQFQVGLRDEAAKLLEEVIARDPSIGPAWTLIGWGHALGKRWDEALVAWQKALQFEPTNGDLFANVAALLYRKGDLDGAIRCYINAHRLLPQDAGILAALGVVYAQAKNFERAIVALDQSLQLEANSAVTHSNIGLAFYLFKQVEKAIDHWKMVSRLDRAYADKRGEDMQKSFDDSVITMRSFDWRERVVRLAPMLPRPRTRLVISSEARQGKVAVSDAALARLVAQHAELEDLNRQLAWISVKL